jgi:putative membrane protein
MKRIANVLVGFVALEHIGFLVLEMFFWTKPYGLETFGLTAEFAAQSASLAANQGLYNGFLAAGLVWSLLRKADTFHLKIFFLSCVVIAGVFGALTAKASILYVQGMPALLALILVVLAKQK